MSNLVNTVINSPFTPIGGGSLAITCRSGQILDSEIRWLEVACKVCTATK